MACEVNPTSSFPGFPDFRANVTFVPIQFFTLMVPNCSRGTVRIVGYALRKVLGWVDEHGNPTQEQLRFTYRELIERAGVSRESIADALREAVDCHFLRCVRAPRPDRSGQPAQNGIYELCWDQEGRYTDNPDEFRGFYYPEAAVMDVADGVHAVPRPKAARKNIPNAFFDYVLPRERLSVIRVVSALLFYSIQWGPGGERKVPVSRSITELSRLTKLSRQHVHEAVTEARQRGYIEQVDAGCFDPAAGRENRAATYGIHWAPAVASGRVLRTGPEAAANLPVGKGEREVDGTPVGNGERHQSIKVNGERSTMVNGIRIKTELKTEQTITGNPVPAAAAGFELLTRTGFDESTARLLAAMHSLEAIQRQLEWLPLRHTTRNRLGLLRRAIEQNWAKPESIAPAEEERLKLARTFARSYYAAYHGNEAESAVEPFPKDVEVAAQFSKRLADLTDHTDPGGLGRKFGAWMRARHRGDSRAKPNLSFALVLHGEAFLGVLRRENSVRLKAGLDRERSEHQRASEAAYGAYLREAEDGLKQSDRTLYERFTQERARTRHAMTGGLFLASADTLARFDSDESRLLALADFCRGQPGSPILDFWAWDQQRNSPASEISAIPTDRMAVRFAEPTATDAGPGDRR